MYPLDSTQSECLSLVAGLYGAVADPVRFADQRASCEQWLARQASADTPAASFLRLQIGRAAEARAISTRVGTEVPSACAVLTLDDQGRVIAAGAEAWGLLRSGSAGRRFPAPAPGPSRVCRGRLRQPRRAPGAACAARRWVVGTGRHRPRRRPGPARRRRDARHHLAAVRCRAGVGIADYRLRIADCKLRDCADSLTANPKSAIPNPQSICNRQSAICNSMSPNASSAGRSVDRSGSCAARRRFWPPRASMACCR